MAFIRSIVKKYKNRAFSKGQQRRGKHSGSPKAAVLLLLLCIGISLIDIQSYIASILGNSKGKFLRE